MSEARLLIVDDEPQSVQALRTALIQRGFGVSDARNSAEALEQLQIADPHVILLAASAPGGVDTCAKIRSRSTVPVIFLSACKSKWQEVEAFETGADDYLVKTVGIDELVARIRAILRRAGGSGSRVVALGPVEVDLETHDVKRGGGAEHLTATEFKLFQFLILHAGRIIPYRRLLQSVWGPDCGDEVASLRVCINQLRKKLEPNPAKPQYIRTERHEGYSFVRHPEVRDPRGEAGLGQQPWDSCPIDRVNEMGSPRGRWASV